MNWPLFWALTLAFGVIIGNIMLIKHSAKMKMPNLKDMSEPLPQQRKNDNPNEHDADLNATSHVNPDSAQKKNTPE